jgi:hypothetical protein
MSTPTKGRRAASRLLLSLEMAAVAVAAGAGTPTGLIPMGTLSGW